MRNFAENKILNDLIEAHLDACCFYRAAAGKAELPQLERSFHDLERIHSDIVTDLGIAAYKNGGTSPIERDEDTVGVFNTLRHSIRYTPVDSGLVHAVETAESDCIETLTKAIESEEVSTDIKMHVFEAATLLNKAQPHIAALKNLAGTHLAA